MPPVLVSAAAVWLLLAAAAVVCCSGLGAPLGTADYVRVFFPSGTPGAFFLGVGDGPGASSGALDGLRGWTGLHVPAGAPSLAHVLEAAGAPRAIHFAGVDAGAGAFAALRTFPFRERTIGVVRVASVPPETRTAIFGLLAGHRYALVRRTADGADWYAHVSVAPRGRHAALSPARSSWCA